MVIWRKGCWEEGGRRGGRKGQRDRYIANRAQNAHCGYAVGISFSAEIFGAVGDVLPELPPLIYAAMSVGRSCRMGPLTAAEIQGFPRGLVKVSFFFSFFFFSPLLLSPRSVSSFHPFLSFLFSLFLLFFLLLLYIYFFLLVRILSCKHYFRKSTIKG